MIPIKKNSEPPALALLRENVANQGLSPEDAYATLSGDAKDEVRRALLREQGQLCAYCMCKIPRSDVQSGIAPIVIEHYFARNPVDGWNVGQGLDYNNLLAVCNGNRAPRASHHSYRDLTCDAHKGNTKFLKVNPCDPDTLATIAYRTNGEIYATDADVNTDLTVTLNLNCRTAPVLSEREAVLSALIMDMGTIEKNKLQEYCKSILSSFQNESDIKTPYQGILIWYLDSMLEALSSEKNH